MSDTTSAVPAGASPAISISGVFSRTFAVLFANLIPFSIISFLVQVPLLLFNLAMDGGVAPAPDAIRALLSPPQC